MVQTCLTHVEAFSLLQSQMLEICSGSLRYIIEVNKASAAVVKGNQRHVLVGYGKTVSSIEIMSLRSVKHNYGAFFRLLNKLPLMLYLPQPLVRRRPETMSIVR